MNDEMRHMKWPLEALLDEADKGETITIDIGGGGIVAQVLNYEDFPCADESQLENIDTEARAMATLFAISPRMFATLKAIVDCYGVCDNLDQLLAACPELEASDRRFVVTLTPVRKVDQSPDSGWRWHKWGPYIGTKNPQHEYLYDEPDIDEVLVYQVYEAK